MREIEREYRRAGENSINAHSTRTYNADGELLMLDRTTDASPRFYTLWHIRQDDGFSSAIKVGGNIHFGDGLPWSRAIEMVLKSRERRNQEEE